MIDLPQEKAVKVETLLSEMTDEEMVGLCHGSTIFTSGGVERLGLGELVMSDGPHGVRQEMEPSGFVPKKNATDDESTYLPVGITLGCTWNAELGHAFGRVLGAEARSRGKDVILGPGVNILRTPLCGRNFEYIGEDPVHVGEMAVHVIKGIQSEDVAANVKHFALNNQELNRHGVDVTVDERSLRELYLPAFRRAVLDASCLTVMGAYNLFEGQHCCHHHRLLVEILKGEWGFEGLVISDWGGVHSTVEAARDGLDIEMSGNLTAFYLAEDYLAGIRDGHFSREGLRDKARRNLKVRYAIRKGEAERKPGARLIPDHEETALQIAREGIVLLKNEGEILPLQTGAIHRVAVIGANATARHAAGGGSSGIKAVEEITPLEGLEEVLGADVTIDYVKGYPLQPEGMEAIPQSVMATTGKEGIRGWRMKVFDTREWQAGQPLFEMVTPSVEWGQGKMPEGKELGQWSIVWEGKLTVEESGTYRLVCEGGDFLEVHVDGKTRVSVWDLTAPCQELVALEMGTGEAVALRIVYRPKVEAQGISLKWIPPFCSTGKAAPGLDEAIEAARKADLVLYFGGSDHRYDTEGMDRPDMRLPYEQDALITALSEANSNMVVTLFSGSAMELPWLDQVKGLLFAGYPGQKGGQVLAEILTGAIVPSGRLSFSWPRKLEDVPAHHFGDYGPNKVVYREGLRHGYWWLGKAGPEPLFPFGYGLSTTTFDVGELYLQYQDEALLVQCSVSNTGQREGAVVLQCFVQPEGPAVAEFPMALKAFSKVHLLSGESRRIHFRLGREDLLYWDISTNSRQPAGERYRVVVGQYAGDEKAHGMVDSGEG